MNGSVIKSIQRKLWEINLNGPSLSPEFLTLGLKVTIKGRGFGNSRGKVSSLKVLNWKDDEICCALAKGLIAGRPEFYDVFVIPKNGSSIFIESAFKVKVPQIESIEPTKGSSGDYIEILGELFGTKKGKVYLGDKLCKIHDWRMDAVTGESRIKFIVPKGLSPGKRYDIKVANLIGENVSSKSFRYGA